MSTAAARHFIGDDNSTKETTTEQQQQEMTTTTTVTPTTSEKPKAKRILYWTGFYPSKDFMFGFGQKPFIDIGCKVNNCVTTDDRTKLNESDAIIFHFHRYNYNVNDMPPFRLPHQRYIFYLYEALAHDVEMPFSFAQFANRTANFFNWTMSHRRDSDIYSAMTYGAIQRKKTSPISDRLPPKLANGVRPESPSKLMDPFASAKEKLKKKTKLVAWFCSHKATHGKRQEYFTELSKHVAVDIYGSCGNLTCQPSMSQKCNDLLDTYKFYVSAENSLCPDYVTEKLYRALWQDVVPIVYGGADYSQYAPPHSIINVADFKSPKDLADYLNLLDKNDALYVRHFEWKRDWEQKGFPRDGWCDLCEKLNDPSEPVKIYSDLYKWWFDDVPCLKGDVYLSNQF